MPILNNSGVTASEKRNNGTGCRKTDDVKCQENDGAYTDTEPAGFLYAIIKSGTKAVTAYRLEALTKTDNSGVDKNIKAADNGHSRNGSITIRLAHKIHQGSLLHWQFPDVPEREYHHR